MCISYSSMTEPLAKSRNESSGLPFFKNGCDEDLSEIDVISLRLEPVVDRFAG